MDDTAARWPAIGVAGPDILRLGLIRGYSALLPPGEGPALVDLDRLKKDPILQGQTICRPMIVQMLQGGQTMDPCDAVVYCDAPDRVSMLVRSDCPVLEHHSRHKMTRSAPMTMTEAMHQMVDFSYAMRWKGSFRLWGTSPGKLPPQDAPVPELPDTDRWRLPFRDPGHDAQSIRDRIDALNSSEIDQWIYRIHQTLTHLASRGFGDVTIQELWNDLDDLVSCSPGKTLSGRCGQALHGPENEKLAAELLVLLAARKEPNS